MSSSGIASSSPMPITCGASRGRDHDVVAERAESRRLDRVGRRPQRVRGAVVERRRLLLVGDHELALGRHAEDGTILELVAVHRVRIRSADSPLVSGERQPQQQPEVAVAGGGRDATAVEEVARRARLGVEHRAEAVACVGRRRCGHPVLGEEASRRSRRCDAPRCVSVGAGKREGVARRRPRGWCRRRAQREHPGRRRHRTRRRRRPAATPGRA